MKPASVSRLNTCHSLKVTFRNLKIVSSMVKHLSCFYIYVYTYLHTQDPLKEKETEMVMDYIERFNEVSVIMKLPHNDYYLL